MASRARAVAENTPGDVFVDATCINCDTCRILAPAVFGDSGKSSYVKHQPRQPSEALTALRALLSCPTGSIGASNLLALAEARADFPLLIDDDVYYCGYASEKSFGGSSYFIVHEDGNWLIDSPRYLDALAKQFDHDGGVQYIFLTHRDDVADADKYAARFGAQRIIHRQELAAQPDAEIVLEGDTEQRFGEHFTIIPTPGHTAGHCALLYRDKYLFTGDHLWWQPEGKQLEASRDYCWWSWPAQLQSLARLQAYTFEHVLPGHGYPIHLSAAEMQQALGSALARYQSDV